MEECEAVKSFYLTFPAICAVIAGSGTGKTFLVDKILKQMDTVAPTSLPIGKFVLCYRYWQPIYDSMIATVKQRYPSCEILVFNEYPNSKLKDEEFWNVENGCMSFLVIDDQSDLIRDSFPLICRGLSHHKKICTVYISQDYSSESKIVKDALKNAQLFFLMRSAQSGPLLQDLNRRLYLYSPRFLASCFNKVIELGNAYSYLIIDKNPETEALCSVKTGIFSDEDKYVFQPRI